ncbi:hypothetical protein ASZ78_006716, partial [Callipepla squamata]
CASCSPLVMWCSASVDILFLLDGSYSVGRGSFERSKHFAGKLCDALDIHPGRVRVGMIQFSSTPHLEFPLNSYLTKQEVKERIKTTVFRGGSTETGRALKYILRKGFPGGRNLTVPKILIIISDGKSQGSTTVPATQMKERGTTVFAVGIKFPRWEELHALASEPTEQHVLFAGDASDAVNGLYSALSSSVCSVTTPGCEVESFPCERRTLESEKELAGNYVCWKGSKLQNTVYASLCPFYRLKRVSIRHPSRCFRTVCVGSLLTLHLLLLWSHLDPCDSQPCQNGGTCVPEGLDKYHCLCPMGYGGGVQCGRCQPDFSLLPSQLSCLAPKLSLECGVDLLFLMDSSAGVTLEGFLRYKAFLKRFLHAVMSWDSPTNVGVAQYDTNVRIPIEVGQHKDAFGLMKSIDALSFSGGGTLTGRALRYVAQHGFRSTPVFADVLDDLPRVVVLLTDSKSQDPVAEAAKYARDRDLFLIGVGSSFVRAELAEVTGNPKQTIVYSDPQDLFNKIPELQRRICSVNRPEEAKSPVNLCKPNPCMNQGVCILRPGSYWCDCHGWEGPHCESRVPRGDSPRSPVLPTGSHVQQFPSSLQHFSGAHQHPRRT